MPAESTRMSAMLPGTRRSMTKMSTDIPKRVRTINSTRRVRYAPILVVPPYAWTLLVEPDVFETPAVVDAVVLQDEVLHGRRPAGVRDAMRDRRTRPVLEQ